MPIYGFSDERDIRRVADATRWVERKRGLPGPPSTQRGMSPSPIFARSTGAVVDTNFAEGFIVVYTGLTATDYGACYLTTIDNQPPAEGTYFGRIVGLHTTSPGTGPLPIVRVVESAEDIDPDECGYLAGLDSNDCLSAEVYQASGRCEDVPVTQSVTLEWDAGDSRWESADNIVVKPSGATATEGPLAYWIADGRPRLALLDADAVHYEFRYLGCLDGHDTFAGGGALICDGETDGPCTDNTIRVRVQCSPVCDSGSGGTVTVPCCETPIPERLCFSMSIAGGTGDCECWNDEFKLILTPIVLSGDVVYIPNAWDGAFQLSESCNFGLAGATVQCAPVGVENYWRVTFGIDYPFPDGSCATPPWTTTNGVPDITELWTQDFTCSPFEATWTIDADNLLSTSGNCCAGTTITVTVAAYDPMTGCGTVLCADCPEGFPESGFALDVGTVTGDAGYADLEGSFSLFNTSGCDFKSATSGIRWEMTAGGDLVGTTSGGATVTFTRAADFNCCENNTFTKSASSGTWTAPTSLTVTPVGECGPIDIPDNVQCPEGLAASTGEMVFATSNGEVSVLWNSSTLKSAFTNSGIASGYVRFVIEDTTGLPSIEWWDDLPENGGTLQATFSNTGSYSCTGSCYVANFGPGYTDDSLAILALFNDATTPVQVIIDAIATGSGWPYECAGGCTPGGSGTWVATCSGGAWGSVEEGETPTCANPGAVPTTGDFALPCSDGASAVFECNTCTWTYNPPP